MADEDREGASTRRPTLSEVLSRWQDALRETLHTQIVGKVTRYDASKQQVDVQILVQNPYLDEEEQRQVESVAVVPNCPVRFLSGGSFRITCPISDGNLVINGQKIPATLGILQFSERSLEKWLSGQGQEVDPELDHRHALTDAWFIPGLRPFGSPLSAVPTDKLSIGRDQSPSDIEVSGDGTIDLAGGGPAAARQGDHVGGGKIDNLKFTGTGVVSFDYTDADGVKSSLTSAAPSEADIVEKIQEGSSKVNIGP